MLNFSKNILQEILEKLKKDEKKLKEIETLDVKKALEEGEKALAALPKVESKFLKMVSSVQLINPKSVTGRQT